MDNPPRTRGRSKKYVEKIPTKIITRTSIGVASMSASGSSKKNVSSATAVSTKKSSPSRSSRYSPSRRASPGRTHTSPAKKHTSPLRRSSRPRSTIPSVHATVAYAPQSLSPTKEELETRVSHTNLPTTLTTNTSTRAPGKKATTSSTQSSYSSTTQKTVNIRTSASDINKLADYIRRSVSKTFSRGGGVAEDRQGSFTPSIHTEGESRYSRSASRSVCDSDRRYTKAEFSDTDGDDVIVEENEEIVYEENAHYRGANNIGANQKSLCRKVLPPKEFGGSIAITLIMTLIPCFVYYLLWCCSSQGCALKMPNIQGIFDKKYLVEDVFDGYVASTYLAFLLGIFLLSAILFGFGVRLPGHAEHKFNAFPMSIVFLLAFAAAEYYQIPVADFIVRNYLRFAIYGLLNAYVVALWAYIRSDMLKEKGPGIYNVYAKSGNILVDYALGRQLNPKWLGLVEFKQVFYKASLMSTFMYAICLIYKNIEFPILIKESKREVEDVSYFISGITCDVTALLCATMLLLYVFDSILFEHHLSSSFELQGEGFGCLLLLRYAASTYLLSAVAKYFYEHRTLLNCNFAICIPLFLLILGVGIKRFSNAIKYKYRVQPNHPHFIDMETIHTFQGKRLLLGCFWGRVRQPNYLGDIIAIIALGLPLTMRFAWPPLLCLLLIVILLVHRCFRVNERNASRYYSSWVRYCNVARNYMIPNIF